MRVERTVVDHAGPWALGRLEDADGRIFPALVARTRFLDLSAHGSVGAPASATLLLERWDDVRPVLDGLARSVASWHALEGMQFRSPVEPRQVFRAGANHRSHVIDLAVAHHDGSDRRSLKRVRADAAAEMDARLQHPPYAFQACRAQSAARSTTWSFRTTGSSRIGSSSSRLSSAAGHAGCRPGTRSTSWPGGRS